MTENEIVGIVFGSILLLGIVVFVIVCVVLSLIEYNAVRAKKLQKENEHLLSENDRLNIENERLYKQILSLRVDVMNFRIKQFEKADSVGENEDKK